MEEPERLLRVWHSRAFHHRAIGEPSDATLASAAAAARSEVQRSAPLRLPATAEPECRREADHQRDAERGAERPVACSTLELILDDVADHVDPTAAENVVDGVNAE